MRSRATVAESLGYETVAINLYRPEWDDFECTTVHGSAEARGGPRRARAPDRGLGAAALRPFQQARRVLRAGRRVRLVEGRRGLLSPRSSGGRRRRRVASGRRALRADAPSRRPPRRHPLRRRAGEPPARDRRGARRARGARRPRRARRAVGAGGGRGRAPPPRARAAAHGVDGPDRAPERGRDHAARLRRRARRTRLPERHGRLDRPGDRAGHAAGRRRLGARERRVAGALPRRPRSAARPRVRDRGLLPRAERGGGEAHLARDVPVHVAAQRTRSARMGPSLAARAAARRRRGRHRDPLRRRAGRPAAPVAGEAPGAAHLREPGSRGDRRRRERAGAPLPRRSRSAHAPAEPPCVRRAPRVGGRARKPVRPRRSASCSATSTASRA